jgi:hypothetical protein
MKEEINTIKQNVVVGAFEARIAIHNTIPDPFLPLISFSFSERY